MRLYDLHDREGRVFAFEVNNFFPPGRLFAESPQLFPVYGLSDDRSGSLGGARKSSANSNWTGLLS
jgi:hypothetical protein